MSIELSGVIRPSAIRAILFPMLLTAAAIPGAEAEDLSLTSFLGEITDTLGAPAPDNARALLGGSGDLSFWHGDKKDTKEPEWKFEDGALCVTKGTGNILTSFDVHDFHLHVEFNVNSVDSQKIRKNGNSGVYIQQRYEVQILNTYGREPAPRECGAIYKFRAPKVNASRPAGEWQSYDIIFRAARWDDQGNKSENARISVLHNGSLIHDNVEIPNKTGAGKKEGPEDLPLKLQNHGNPVRFRNIWFIDLTGQL